VPPELDLDEAVRRAHASYAAARPRSRALHERALGVLAGGNTRSVLDFSPFPFQVARAAGAELVDVDGHTYVDFCGNYTAGLLGHDPAAVRRAVDEALDGGWAVGAMHPREIELAELVTARFPAMARVRFTNSGTEANLMAVATALHHTGRTGVGVFEGGYHGGVLSFDHGPSPMTVPHRFVVAPFDEPAGLDTLFADPDLGCVLVEAVQGAGGCRVASPGWLRELRRRCTDSGVVLVLDEVMTSRLSPGGAQRRYQVTPDMTTLGKYLGGGMPFGAFGGREDVMRHFDRSAGGRLVQAGTFNNNVVSLAAAIATLRHALDDDVLEAVNTRGDRLRTALGDAFSAAGVAMHVTGLGSMLTVHAADQRLAELYFHAMLADGHHLARRGFVALSFAVTDAHVDALVAATRRWCRGISAAGRG
jgi:glutamate-1-semialdehyde 2,1-aminomutase